MNEINAIVECRRLDSSFRWISPNAPGAVLASGPHALASVKSGSTSGDIGKAYESSPKSSSPVDHAKALRHAKP